MSMWLALISGVRLVSIPFLMNEPSHGVFTQNRSGASPVMNSAVIFCW